VTSFRFPFFTNLTLEFIYLSITEFSEIFAIDSKAMHTILYFTKLYFSL